MKNFRQDGYCCCCGDDLLTKWDDQNNILSTNVSDERDNLCKSCWDKIEDACDGLEIDEDFYLEIAQWHVAVCSRENGATIAEFEIE